MALASVSAGSSPQRRRPEDAPPPPGGLPVLEDRAWLTVLRPSPTRHPTRARARATASRWRRTSSCCSAPPATSPSASCCPAWPTSRSRRSRRTSGSSARRWTTSSTDEFRALARRSVESFGTHKIDDAAWQTFADRLTYVPQGAGPEGLTAAVKEAETLLGPGCRRLHYLSVPPKAAEAVIGMLRDADLTENARVVMEKPFGTRPDQRRAAQRLRALGVRRVADLPHRPLPRQGGGAEHPRVPLRERAVRADLEPQLHRPRPDRHPRDARAGPAGELLRVHRRLQGHGGHPPDAGDGVRRHGAADGAGTAGDQRGEEQGLPLDAADRPAQGGPRPVRRLPRGAGVRPRLGHRDVHRAAGRHRQLALGGRAVLPAHRQEDGRGPAHHLDRVQGGAADDVPGELRRRRRRARTT